MAQSCVLRVGRVLKYSCKRLHSIANVPPGEFDTTMASSIKDVAREVAVSVATVSRALNGHRNLTEDVRRRVQAAAQRLSYTPHHAARSRSSRRTNTIGVVLPDLHGEYFSELMRGIDSAARTDGKQLLVSGFLGEPGELVRIVLRRQRRTAVGVSRSQATKNPACARSHASSLGAQERHQDSLSQLRFSVPWRNCGA